MWFVPSAIFPSSLAAEDSISGSTELFEALSASLTWRGKHSPVKFWKRVWRKASWLQHLSTRMLRASEADLFAAWWTQSLAEAPARTCLSLGSEMVLVARDLVFSTRWVGSSKSPSLPGSSGKTSSARKSSSRSSSKNSNESVTPGKEPSFELLMWEPPISEPESSFSQDEWSTPKASETDRGVCEAEARRRSPALLQQAADWGTPQARDWKGIPGENFNQVNLPRDVSNWQTPSVGNATGGNQTRGAERSSELLLPGQASSWQTPRASDAENGGPNQTLKGKPALTAQARSQEWPTPSSSYGSNQGGAAGRTGAVRPSLQTMGRLWPTTTTSDAKASGAAGYSTDSGRHAGTTTLTDAAVRSWPTPITSDAGKHSPAVTFARGNPTLTMEARSWPTAAAAADAIQVRRSPADFQRNSPSLAAVGGNFVPSGLQDPMETGRAFRLGSSRLNPAFVEWLMGWPEGWTLPWKPSNTKLYFGLKIAGPTDFECWGTESSPDRPKKLSGSSFPGSSRCQPSDLHLHVVPLATNQDRDIPRGVKPNRKEYEKMAAANRMAFLKGLSKAKASGGAYDNFKDGKYRLVVKKMSFEDKLKETIFKVTFTVMNATKIPVQSVKTGEKLDIEPNRPGSDVDWVCTKLNELDSVGPGNIRRLMMDLFNVREISDDEYFETLSEMTDYDPATGEPLKVPLELAKGLVIDMETTRIETKKNKKEIAVCKWSFVASNVEKGKPQTEAERVAMIGWLAQVAAQQTPAAAQAAA